MKKLFLIKIAVMVILSVIAVSLVVCMTSGAGDDLTAVVGDYLSLVDKTSVGNRKDKFYEDFYDIYYTYTDITDEDNPFGIKGPQGDRKTKKPPFKSGLGYDTKEEAEAALKVVASRNNGVEAAWKVQESAGKFFVIEKQSGNWWGTVGNKGNTLSGAGCMWFATAALYSAISEEPVSVADLLKSVGFKVRYNKAGQYFTDPVIETIGTNKTSGYKYPNGMMPCPESIMTSYSGKAVSDSVKPDRSKIQSGKCVYLVHAAKDTALKVSGGGEHWFVITGYDSSSNLYNLINCKTSSCDADYVDSHLNHAYAVDF